MNHDMISMLEDRGWEVWDAMDEYNLGIYRFPVKDEGETWREIDLYLYENHVGDRLFEIETTSDEITAAYQRRMNGAFLEADRVRSILGEDTFVGRNVFDAGEEEWERSQLNEEQGGE